MATFASFKQLAAKFDRAAKDLKGTTPGKSFEEAVKKSTEVLYARSKELMNSEIYAIPEGRVTKGKPPRRGGREAIAWAATTPSRPGLIGRDILQSTEGDKTTWRGGDKKWRRTGLLRRSEKMRPLIQGWPNPTGVVWNDARRSGGFGYALARHNLGLTGGDLIIPPAPTKRRDTERIAPWRAQAIKDTREQMSRFVREASWGALSSR